METKQQPCWLVNHLRPRLLSAEWAELLPQNWSDERPSETNPSNPENGKKPAGVEIGGEFHLHGPVRSKCAEQITSLGVLLPSRVEMA